MSDNRPGSRDRKLSWIGPASIAAVLVGLLVVAWLSQMRATSPEPPRPPPTAAAPPAPVVDSVPLPATQPSLTRTDLIEAADQAREAFAIGETRGATKKDSLLGRAFMVRIPFGCDGARGASSGAQAYVEYDAGSRTLRVIARPGVWTTLPLISALANARTIERVEGFWIPRPWSPADSCPPRLDSPAPATPTPLPYPTLGLAQVFEVGASRVQQRGDRPYEFVRKVPEADTTLLDRAYGLVLTGRIVGFSDGRAIRCWAESADHRPICVYGVVFDRVALVDASTDEQFAEWRE